MRLAIIGFWAGLGVLDIVRALINSALSGIPRTLTEAVLLNFSAWFLWFFFTIVVVAAARRFPIEGSRRLPAVGAHVLVATLVATAHLSLLATLLHYTLPTTSGLVHADLPAQILSAVGAYGVLNFFAYWMILGGYHALLYHRRYAEGLVREADARTRAAVLEGAAAEATLQALRMELNPHFLFNSLNSVAGLIEEDRKRDAVTMLSRLGGLLRATLRRGQERAITVGQEIDYVNHYLDVESIRFDGRLDVEVAAEPDVRPAVVPPMVLQPLVENALRHGTAQVRGTGWIRVSAFRRDERLHLVVVDNGPGPEDLGGAGTGLRNLRARLQATYGPAAHLSVGPAETGGCRAEIVLPFRPGESAADSPGAEGTAPSGPATAASGAPAHGT